MKWLVLALVLISAHAWLFTDFSQRKFYNISTVSEENFTLNITAAEPGIKRFSWLGAEETAVSFWEQAGPLYWIRLPSSSENETVCVYYDAGSATSQSNATATFREPWAFFPFEGNANDIISGNNGDYTDTAGGDDPVNQAGLFGNETFFEDEGDAVNVSRGAVNGLMNFTISLWFRTDRLPATIFSVSNQGEADELVARLANESGQKYAGVFVKGTEYTVDSDNLADNSWHHLWIFRNEDDGELTVRIDGGADSVFTGVAGGAVSADNNGFWLGKRQESPGVFLSENFTGHLDDLRIYGKFLNTTMDSLSKLGLQYALGTEQLFFVDAFGDSVNISIFDGDELVQDSAGNLTEGFSGGIYNVTVGKTLSQDWAKIIFENLNLSLPFRAEVEFKEGYSGSLPDSVNEITPIVAVNETGSYSQAQVYIPKNGVDVNAVAHCLSWDFDADDCSEWEIKPKSRYAYSENTTHLALTVTEFDGYGGANNTPTVDFTTGIISFNTTSPREDETVKISANITNTGDSDIWGLVIRFNGTDCNGAGYGISNETADIPVNTSLIVNATYGFEICTHTVNVFSDPENEFSEYDETNNQNSTQLFVGMWSYCFGNTTSAKGAGDSFGRYIKQWTSPDGEGNVFFVDSETSIDFFSLRAMNGTDDLNELDTALGTENMTDSVKKIYDADDNGEPDATESFTVFGGDITEVPVYEAYSGSPWNTGILWDGSDGGSEYDGTQDVVFIAKATDLAGGAWGYNSYEVRIPALLRSLKGIEDTVSVFLEVN